MSENKDQKKIIPKRIIANRIKRKVRRQQLLLRRLRVIIRILLIFFLIYFSYRLVNLHYWYFSSDILNSKPLTKHVKIYGNNITPNYQIISALRQVEIPNKPIYLLDTKPFVNEILKLAPIKKVYITRFWLPTRLEVIIEEREPLILIAPGENSQPVAFFTKDGVLIGRNYLNSVHNFDTIKVLSYGIHGDDYRKWDINKIKNIEILAQAIETYSGEKLVYLDLRNPKDIYAKIESNLLRIGEFNNTLFKRIKSIKVILPEAKTLDKKIKYIDLRWDEARYIKLEEE